MNPSYNSGGTNTPGVKPGVIASGPDPTDAIPSNSVKANRAFGRRTTTNTNTNVGTNTIATQAPVNTSIVINTANTNNKRSSKRGLFLAGGIIMMVATIVLIVLAVVMAGKGGGGSVNRVDFSTAFEDFSKYALYGNPDSEAKIEDAVIGETVIATTARNGTFEIQEEYFNKLNEYAKTLADSAKGSGVEQTANELKTNVVMLEKLSEVAYTDVLMDKYFSNGASGISDYMNSLTEVVVADDEASSALEASQLLADESSKVYDAYSKGGCITKGETDGSTSEAVGIGTSLSTDCINALVEGNANLARQIDTIGRQRITIKNYVKSLINQIYDAIMTINNTTGGGQND